MSHGPAVCSPSTFLNGFGEGIARANDPKSAAKAARNAVLHRKLAKYGRKWSAWLVGNVCFPIVKLMISCFHQKLHKQVLVGPL